VPSCSLKRAGPYVRPSHKAISVKGNSHGKCRPAGGIPLGRAATSARKVRSCVRATDMGGAAPRSDRWQHQPELSGFSFTFSAGQIELVPQRADVGQCIAQAGFLWTFWDRRYCVALSFVVFTPARPQLLVFRHCARSVWHGRSFRWPHRHGAHTDRLRGLGKTSCGKDYQCSTAKKTHGYAWQNRCRAEHLSDPCTRHRI